MDYLLSGVKNLTLARAKKNKNDYSSDTEINQNCFESESSYSEHEYYSGDEIENGEQQKKSSKFVSELSPEDAQNSRKALMNEFLLLHSKPLIPAGRPPQSTVTPVQPFNNPYNGVPHRIIRALAEGTIYKLAFPKRLVPENYSDFFKHLLWIEEATQAADFMRYSLKNVNLTHYSDRLFSIKVPGLEERRPSVLPYDKVILKNEQRKYEVFVHKVLMEEILVEIDDGVFKTDITKLKFNVNFSASRTCHKRCLYSVERYCDDVDRYSKMLFATKININMDLKIPVIDIRDQPEHFKTFNKKLNNFQKEAIINILRNICRPVPYILFGPPGTGKTVTLVEAALQAYTRRPKSKILLVSNSNASTDLIATFLKNSNIVKLDEIARLSAYYRFEYDGHTNSPYAIPEEIRDITVSKDDIDWNDWFRYRIIVTTCTQAACLYDFIPNNEDKIKDKSRANEADFFDFVFIDESGHATEPEALIALNFLKRKGCCAIAGDPYQLGPVIISDCAKKLGLGTSLLERYFNRFIAEEKGTKIQYNPHYVTKLRISFRSDARIMEISNKLFYQNDLTFVSNCPSKYLVRFRAEFPLIFHAVKGQEKKSYSSPSWYNIKELSIALYYMKLALSNKFNHPSQVGFITPYREQMYKMSRQMQESRLGKCKIGTMEEFQGTEKEVIIISTVRTTKASVENDKKFNLGFLHEPKRFNVGISRAKYMVIVVGDPDILKEDLCWSEYMDVCRKQGTYRETDFDAIMKQEQALQESVKKEERDAKSKSKKRRSRKKKQERNN